MATGPKFVTGDLFADAPPAPKAGARICRECGTTEADLHTDGRMGCAHCYEVFSSEAHRALIVLHNATRHFGKTLPGTGS